MISRGAAAASTSARATAAGEAQRDAWLGCITWWDERGDEFGEVSAYSKPPSQGQNLKVLEQQEQRQRLGEWIICDFLVVEVFPADCVHARVVPKAPLPRQGMPMSTSMLTPAAMQLPLLGRNQK